MITWYVSSCLCVCVWYFISHNWLVSGGSKGAPPVPLRTKMFLISCSFWEQSGKFVRFSPHLEGWRPLLQGILDPPLLAVLVWNCRRLYINICSLRKKSKGAKRVKSIIFKVGFSCPLIRGNICLNVILTHSLQERMIETLPGNIFTKQVFRRY